MDSTIWKCFVCFSHLTNECFKSGEITRKNHGNFLQTRIVITNERIKNNKTNQKNKKKFHNLEIGYIKIVKRKVK